MEYFIGIAHQESQIMLHTMTDLTKVVAECLLSPAADVRRLVRRLTVGTHDSAKRAGVFLTAGSEAQSRNRLEPMIF